jgi:hypothetical protein
VLRAGSGQGEKDGGEYFHEGKIALLVAAGSLRPNFFLAAIAAGDFMRPIGWMLIAGGLLLGCHDTSSGSFDGGIARGQCRTDDLAPGLDGTPIQLLPKALAPANTCSYRWWPAALH